MSMPVVPLELDGVIAHERRGFGMDGVVVHEFERIVGVDDSRRRMTTLGAGTTAAQIAVCVGPLVSVPPSDGHSPLDSFDQARKHTHEKPSPRPLPPQAVPWRIDRGRPRQAPQQTLTVHRSGRPKPGTPSRRRLGRLDPPPANLGDDATGTHSPRRSARTNSPSLGAAAPISLSKVPGNSAAIQGRETSEVIARMSLLV
jgi:hypothetical protein